MSVWTRSAAARVLAITLTRQGEFWQHVAAVRDDDSSAEALARRYFRRDQGRRIELLARYLRTAAARPRDDSAQAVAKHVEEWRATIALAAIGGGAWFVGAPVNDETAPLRSMKDHAAQALAEAALVIARRGAGRCVDCGTILAADTARRDSCSSCDRGVPVRHRDALARQRIDAERELVDAAVDAVLGDAVGRQIRRRRRRAA